jgi:hypothetical protein
VKSRHGEVALKNVVGVLEGRGPLAPTAAMVNLDIVYEKIPVAQHQWASGGLYGHRAAVHSRAGLLAARGSSGL